MNATVPASPVSEAIPHNVIARFTGDLARLWPDGDRLGLAVSGGPDSLALLLLARVALPGRVEVITVDHGLRAESAGECAMVKELCAAYNIPCEMARVTVPSGNLQDRARRARYAAFAQWMKQRDLSAIATAHHADDQAETLVMRLNRGSGINGLAGVRPRGMVPGTKLALLRPLLSWRRSDLAKIVERSGLQAVHDPSNFNPRFDRVRIRQALAEADWLEPQALAASASHLADAEEVLAWASDREWKERVTVGEDGAIRYRPHSPKLVVMRVVLRAINMLGGSPRGGAVANLIMRLQNGKDSTLSGVIARSDHGVWVFRKEPPRRISGPS
ncbi:tRNA lysidine(34) synthetase TilS [Altericroceibacterium spongiae]|uniref:tRNA(Ile)-lysidine synthase n=1 Tax=Altericroceibacterium spongiae TaxID=2320269 RepID=A0A420EKB9_9SPHN|nr:tRNA lysidine(34) synthetase TilS [Altericroceibacterium spongiae]RKF21046.1 tRNA lysidine(34) synthetase TilS [Altericroceibacterium spongiae]